jgi:D-arabinitol dehydrogenase (NADP+)
MASPAAPTGEMNALWYNSPKDFTFKNVPIPTVGDDDILLKVSLCGVCGTDGHIHDGEFIAKFPVSLPSNNSVMQLTVKAHSRTRGRRKRCRLGQERHWFRRG